LLEGPCVSIRASQTTVLHGTTERVRRPALPTELFRGGTQGRVSGPPVTMLPQSGHHGQTPAGADDTAVGSRSRRSSRACPRVTVPTALARRLKSTPPRTLRAMIACAPSSYDPKGGGQPFSGQTARQCFNAAAGSALGQGDDYGDQDRHHRCDPHDGVAMD